MRDREDIYTSLSRPTTFSSRGVDENCKVYIHQKQHAGIKALEGRDIYLVMTPLEALQVAVGTFGAIPAVAFDTLKDWPEIKTLVKYLKSIKAL